MNASEIRKVFLDFFNAKGHTIVPSAPMVLKDDPTLMFTNAGMNQFKDVFLGNQPAKSPRVADTQKCLRVSGKHNDLEEVGKDTYHHTMFEMLGNWSFGDYFKKEAIAWAWELLTEVYGIDKNSLYVTVFEGDEKDGTAPDHEALAFWKEWVSEDRILFGSKKDNFWEMGESGPCGPCSEIHADIRDAAARRAVDGKTLVNRDHPEVIEIWNLVFIQYNRKANGQLDPLPHKHVDTGMGFERLCMVLQGKRSNYDTDVFQPLIKEIQRISGKIYGGNLQGDIALRVIADHIRAIAFAIADGQLPSNNKAGYVIRRILRRAVRYGYTFLDMKEPFMADLVPVLVGQMKGVFPEMEKQAGLIAKVVTEEELSFLKTLATGIQLFEKYVSDLAAPKIDGQFAFELFDTYGFPVDLTQLMASERSLHVDMDGFGKELEKQKARSRQAAAVDTGDWHIIGPDRAEVKFVGYDTLSCEAHLLRYRKVKAKGSEYYQLVFDQTPFYAASGGQVGDRGQMESESIPTEIFDTVKENELTVHLSATLPADLKKPVVLIVDRQKREQTARNHSATHLMHAALREVLGSHVEQKGSLVDEHRLRFDFAHFSKLTDDEVNRVEQLVNQKIREGIALSEYRELPIEQAKKMGAVALFGEKYGDRVRVVAYDTAYSVELCGGTHVGSTAQIQLFKLTSESAIAAGIRRIEAITGDQAMGFLYDQLRIVEQIKQVLKTKDALAGVQTMVEANASLEAQLADFRKAKQGHLEQDLRRSAEQINGVNFISAKVDLDAGAVKDLAFKLKDAVEDLFLVLGAENDGKALLTVMISDNLVREKTLNASVIVRELAKEVQGSGGGQPFFATAGGKNPQGIGPALEKAKGIVAAS